MTTLLTALETLAYYDYSGFSPVAYIAGIYGGATVIGLILIAAAGLIGIIVQHNLSSSIKRNSQIPAPMTGADVARLMLEQNGIYDVQVISTPGELTDHYNPTNKTVNLSENVYHCATVTAVAVAAHECGHAIQHAKAYPWLGLRSSLVPIVNIGSHLGQIVIFIGLILLAAGTGTIVAWIGLALFATTTLFAFVTLPVEFDASRRALAWLNSSGLADHVMHGQAQNALRSAAMTYVAAALSSLAMLIYYALIILNRSSDRD